MRAEHLGVTPRERYWRCDAFGEAADRRFHFDRQYHRKYAISVAVFDDAGGPTWTSIAPCSVSSRTSRRCAPVPQAASWTRPARDALPEGGRLRTSLDMADISNWSSASAGVCQASVFRGLVLRAAATAAMSSAVCMLRSVPFGKYWRSSPLVFSLVPRCHGL